MDRIIKSISEIESDSVKIMDDANAKKSEIFSQIQNETIEFDQTIEEETAARIKELKEKLEKDMSEKLSKQKDSADRFLHSLEQHYKENHTSYVESLFRDMTGA